MSDTSDFTPQPYSLQSQPLTPTPGETQSATLSLTASASIMTNYQPALPVSSQHKICAVEDINGNPIIFSIGNTNELYAIVSDPTQQTGWAQYDLSTALIHASGDTSATVDTFEVTELANNTFAIAMSTASGTGASKVSNVYATVALSVDPAADFWSSFAQQWHARPAPSGLPLNDVSLFVMGPSDGPTLPGIVALVSGDGSHYQRYIINADPAATDPKEIWDEWMIPGNATKADGTDPIIDVVIGKDPAAGFWGTYALFYSGDNIELTFTTLAKFDGKYQSGTVNNCPQSATALSSVRTDYSLKSGGGTDLFVAGDGVWRYDLAALNPVSADDQKPTQVPGTESMGSVEEMEVLCDSDTIALWTLASGRLSYLQSKTSNSAQWTSPVALRKDVGQICALRNKTYAMNELFDVTADNELQYFYRDPSTTIWRTVDIQLCEVDNPIAVDTYTTSLKFVGDSQGAWSGPISLTASSRLYVMVNGATHIVDADLPATVKPDATGALTVITKVTNTSVPIITLSSTDFQELIDISPSQVITTNLQSFAASTAPASATTQVGDPVFPSDAQLTPDQFNTAMAQVTAASDAVTPDTISIRTNPSVAANIVNTSALSSNVQGGSFAVVPGDTTLYTGTDADTVVSSDGATDVSPGPIVSAVDHAVSFFGDVWSSIVNDVEDIGSWALNITEDGIALIINVGEDLLKLALETLEQVFEVLAWIAKQIGMVLEKLIQWIGQLFGWDDIESMAQVLTNGANASFDYASTALTKVGDEIDCVLNDLSVALTGKALDGSDQDAPSPAIPSNIGSKTPNSFYDSTYDGASDQAQQASQYPQTPAGGFATYHMTYSTSDGSGFDAPEASDQGQGALNQLLTGFENLVGNIGGDMKTTFSTTLNEIDTGISSNTMSLSDLVKSICDDLIYGVLEASEDFINGMVQLAIAALELIKEALNKAIRIPFISALYELVTGNSSLTLLNAMSFLTAIPATEMMRVTGQSNLITQLAPLASATKSSDFLEQLGITDDSVPRYHSAAFIAQPQTLTATPSAANADTDSSESTLAEVYDTAVSIFGVFSRAIQDVIAVTNSLVPDLSVTLKKMFSWLSAGSGVIGLALTLPHKAGKGLIINVLRWLIGLFGLVATYIFATASELAALQPVVSGVLTTVDLGLAIVSAISAGVAGVTNISSWASLVGGMIQDIGGLFNAASTFVGDDVGAVAKTVLVTTVITCFALAEVLAATSATLKVVDEVT